ncbi:hypothetical protein BGM26_03550 [Bacillus sp. FJAT-29790]|uniref:DNA sulfur modification protein DndB n=1 Tax=Bacillus sp. FJAT-29790 TaxID=1895002 RepID=UPI001C212C29|nr:DNA sulfur modification protein DndB [Bacillus sp. FJAT-29790]MBU8878066.1 hypothetical protein [Bacillus sp. FJAT-29790]
MIINNVFTKRQSFITYTCKELLAMLVDGRLQLRETNQLHVRGIKKYLFENASTEEIYFPPIVAAVENGKLDNGKPKKMNIVDGSLRLKALSQMEDFFLKAMKSENQEDVKKAYDLMHLLDKTELSVQLFEGLTKAEEDQLYIDMNTKGKQVALSKRIEFDSRSALNQITNKVLQTNKKLRKAGIETEKRSIIRPANKNFLSLSQLRLLVAVFLTGKMTVKTTEIKAELVLKEEEYIELINIWFEKLFDLYPTERIGNYEECMLAGFPLVMAIACYTNREMVSEPYEQRKTDIIRKLDSLVNVDWSRRNSVWKQFNGLSRGYGNYYYLNNDRSTHMQIISWLENQGR